VAPEAVHAEGEAVLGQEPAEVSVPPAVLAEAVNVHHDAPLGLSYEAPVEGVEALIEL
jgi:hypothetical protein